MPNTFIVIPTIRNLDFLHDWADQFADTTLIICEDRPEKSVSYPKIGKAMYHYSWKEIDADLGKDSWIIPRKVSAIRNYGFYQAVKLGAEYIITLDDDCFPVPGHHLVKDHLANLALTSPARWTNSYPDRTHMFTRGMPYLNRRQCPVMLSHGLWTNVLDHDGPTHLQHLSFKAELAEQFVQIIPQHAYYPMCSMNIAFNAEITPLMYFPLMGEDIAGKKWGYDRFDDIWAGIFSKKIMDHLGLGVVNGSPFVEHRKASDPFKNLQKEAKGIETNEVVWQEVDKIKLSKKDILGSYKQLVAKLEKSPKLQEEYFQKLFEAIKIWLKLF